MALHFLGISKIQEGQADKGIELVREALSVKPDYVEAHYNLARALQTIGRLDQAGYITTRCSQSAPTMRTPKTIWERFCWNKGASTRQ